MSPKPFTRLLLLAAGLAAASGCAHAQRLADVDVIDRVTGETLPQYRHRGRVYVAGEPGHAYEIALRSKSGERLLAVMSVDGVNVLSGETAGTGHGGYVFDAYQRDTVRGWRKTLDEIAQFHFTDLPDSYAARTGRPGNVGVIGVALFREARTLRPPPPVYRPYDYEEPQFRDDSGLGAAERSARPQSPAPSASADAAAPEYRSKSRSQAPSLGTGHGRREVSQVGITRFERASSRPDEVITLYYDSYEKLAAMGVLPKHREYARRRPEPFPRGFVPDP